MSRIFVVGEDRLCCALGSKLVSAVLGWDLARAAIETQGRTNLAASLSRYSDLARRAPVLCVADTDGRCPVDLVRQWLPTGRPAGLLLCLAVSEAESWLLADREAFSKFLEVPQSAVPDRPDEIDDPKTLVLNLACRSKRRLIRKEVVAAKGALVKPGEGYNLHLCEFADRGWRPRAAAHRSRSLARAVVRLEAVGKTVDHGYT